MPFDLQATEYDAKLIERLGRSSAMPLSFYRSFAKRALDTLLILCALPLIVPLIAVLAVLIALDGHNPFYTQLRVGRGGRNFRMLKLRTMVPNADEQLARYLEANPEAKAEWDGTQKLKKDPRITTIGRILRKTSIDELPQLFNVLGGSMSLVGPRPMMLSQKDLYPGKGYYDLRPGITGFWQISERNKCDFRDRAKFDDAYNRSLSFRTDVAVIAKTFDVVLRGTGY